MTSQLRNCAASLSLSATLFMATTLGHGRALAADVSSAPTPAADSPIADRDADEPAETASSPTADEPADEHRLRWRWRRFGALDYAATAALGAAYLAVEFGTQQPEDPKWDGAIVFDDAARDHLVASSRTGRDRADRISGYSSIAPLAVLWGETLVVPVFFDDANWDVAWHMTVINLQSSALSGLLTRGGNRVSVRTRPDVAECHEDPDYSRRCFRGETTSFPSGHTSSAFLAAGLSCAHHLNLGLFGGGALDAVMCGVLGLSAAASGVLRIVADRHFASDVIAGAAIGAGSGFALPMLVHYSGGSEAASHDGASPDALRWTFAPLAAADGAGLSIYGWF